MKINKNKCIHVVFWLNVDIKLKKFNKRTLLCPSVDFVECQEGALGTGSMVL